MMAILDSVHRWCVTGTPVTRRMEDLSAQLFFLRADPLADLR
jgi:hypothetical protein